jgi:O-antigen ligase
MITTNRLNPPNSTKIFCLSYLVLLLISLILILFDQISLAILIAILPLLVLVSFYSIRNYRVFGWLIILIQAFGDLSFSNNDVFTISKIGIGFLFLAVVLTDGFSINGISVYYLVASILLITYNFITLFWSEMPESSLTRIISLLFLVLTSYLISFYLSKGKNAIGFFEGYIIFSLLNSVITLLQSYRIINEFSSLYTSTQIIREGGVLINPNANSFQISLGLVLIFLNLFLKKGNRILIQSLFANMLLFVVCLLAILATQSRGGLVSLVIGLTSIIIYYLINSRKIGKVFLITICIIGATLVVYYIFPQYFIEIFGRFLATTTDKFSSRQDIFLLAWKLFLKKPYLGYGPGMFYYLSLPVFGKSLVVHNTFLELLIDGGIVNLIIFLFIILVYINLFLKLPNKVFFITKISLLSLSLTIFSMMMTGTYLTDKNLWILIGITSGITQAYKGNRLIGRKLNIAFNKT